MKQRPTWLCEKCTLRRMVKPFYNGVESARGTLPESGDVLTTSLLAESAKKQRGKSWEGGAVGGGVVHRRFCA